MDINEIAKDTYYFSINNNLSGFITNRNAIKCFDQLVSMSEPGESIHLPFIDKPGSCYYATQYRIIKCTKKPVFRGLHHECLEAILRKS